MASLLETYFSAASPICQEIEREEARSAITSASQSGSDTVMEAHGPNGECLGLMLAESKNWEASFFGCPVIQLSLLLRGREHEERQPVAVALLNKWLGTRSGGGHEYIVIRVPAEDVPLIHALEQYGFSMLVPMVTLERDALSAADGDAYVPGVDLGLVEPHDMPVLEGIAQRAFLYGRFSVEPRLPREIASEMHATWTRNCCSKSLVDEVIVARVEGEPVGFIAVRCRRYGEVQVGEINLIAVAPVVRRSGIGQALVRAGCDWARSRVENIIVRTELPNMPAIRMYEKCGFRIGEGSLYYRLWRS